MSDMLDKIIDMYIFGRSKAGKIDFIGFTKEAREAIMDEILEKGSGDPGEWVEIAKGLGYQVEICPDFVNSRVSVINMESNKTIAFYGCHWKYQSGSWVCPNCGHAPKECGTGAWGCDEGEPFLAYCPHCGSLVNEDIRRGGK